MVRFLLSLAVGMIAGITTGLFVGWELAPVEVVDSPMSALAPRQREDYTIMVAAAYRLDGDLLAAVERLRPLGVENIPDFVQGAAERAISNSRSIEDIRLLVALSEAFGRLTPLMEPYRQVNLPGGGDA
jgi:selenocysteine lyase/cysteine desulfurase